MIQIRLYETRYQSSYKRILADPFLNERLLHAIPAPAAYHSLHYGREVVPSKKKLQVTNWNQVDATSHLKDINRIN